jgi:predicted CopG family antitoxin
MRKVVGVNIVLSEETHEKLTKLKKRLGSSNLSEVIASAIEIAFDYTEKQEET